MKSILEFLVNKSIIGDKYKYYPTTRQELEKIIKNRISKQGKKCDLNDIDTSKITDMSELFYRSKFNGDISNWDVSNVEDMYGMFNQSDFNQDISNWDVSKVKFINDIFKNSPLEKNPPKWYKK